MIRVVLGISIVTLFFVPLAVGAHNVDGEEETAVEEGSLGSSLFAQQLRNFVIDPFLKYTSLIDEEQNLNIIEEKLLTIIDECNTVDSINDRFDCLHVSADQLLATHSFPDIVTAAERTPDCHDLMHHLAQGAYYIYGDLSEVYEHANFACFGAVYHGGVEGYLIEKLSQQTFTQEDIINAILVACEGIDDRAIIYHQCVHGIGHALMFVTASELPESLELCDAFGAIAERVNCYGGVFMENVPESQLSPHVSKYARADDPWYPCRIVDERYRNVCYTFQLSAVEGEGVERLHIMRELCSEVPEKNQYACFLSFGSAVSASISNQEHRMSACLATPGIKSRDACIEGAVVFYLDRFATLPDKLSESLDVCAVAPEFHKENCYKSVGNILRSVPSYDQESICALAGGWEHACLTGKTQ